MRKSKFHVKKAKNGELYWTLVASNGRQICKSSETYKSKQNVKKSIEATRKAFYNITTDAVVTISSFIEWHD